MMILMVGLFLASSALYKSSVSQDNVRGTFWNGEKTAQIRIYKAKNGFYYGKIEKLVEPNGPDGTPKKDPENPNEKLRNRDRIGMVIMKKFAWNAGEQKWENGSIYDPANGKTYDGYMYFEGGNKDVLKLRGYMMGMTWLGRTADWQRIK